MSAPRKGKDISALKARLAKRANPAGAPAAPAAPGVPQTPAAPQQSQQPQQPRPAAAPQRPVARQPQPQQPAQPAIPRPAAQESYSDLEQTRPAGPQDGLIPGPSPSPAPQAKAKAARPSPAGAAEENPFAGGSAFNPDDGLIGGDAGDFKPKGGSKLLVAGVGLGLVGGVALGWMANVAMGKRGKVDIAVNKAGKMMQEVDKVSKSRRSLAIEWDGIKKNLATNPGKGTAKLKEVMQAHFGNGYAREDQLFGWQLGSMNRSTIDSTFSLYRAARSLRSNLRDLARFTQGEGKMLASAGAPARYAVLLKDSKAQLIEFVDALCGADLASGSPCPPNARKKPVGAAVRLAPGGEVKKIPLEKVAILMPSGGYYGSAIASDPKSRAMTRLGQLVSRVDEDLKTMNTAEAATLKGFEKYKADPNIDKDMP